jgi:hypothetical protein
MSDPTDTNQAEIYVEVRKKISALVKKLLQNIHVRVNLFIFPLHTFLAFATSLRC